MSEPVFIIAEAGVNHNGDMGFAGRLIEAFDDPLIGYWSDRTRTRWGRRGPLVVLATPFYALFFVLLWLPPNDHETVTNAIYLFVVIEAFHLFSTLSGGPFESLLPEIAPEKDQPIRWPGSSATCSTAARSTTAPRFVGVIASCRVCTARLASPQRL